jgi:hypothetical protein
MYKTEGSNHKTSYQKWTYNICVLNHQCKAHGVNNKNIFILENNKV